MAGNTPGTVQFSSSASGNDANSGAAVASGTATSGNFTIGAAGMNATLSAAPATVSVGQAITLTLTLTNPGLADVRNFAVGTPSVTSTDGANATLTAGPTPAPPAVLAAGQTVTITWTYSPALTPGLSSGHLSYLVTATGIDAFSGGTITAQPTASSTVQSPAALTATLTPARTPPVPTGQPFTVNTGQVFTMSLAREQHRRGGGSGRHPHSDPRLRGSISRLRHRQPRQLRWSSPTRTVPRPRRGP